MKSVRAPLGVFLILLASYAFFWHSRDWNASSRLMLTYALVDRGTVSIDGLEDHTRDRARFENHFYSDKFPGYSLLAVPSYAIARRIAAVEPHPLNRRGQGFTHWEADYWVTLGTSGVLSALCGAILTALALRWGLGPRSSAGLGLAYGLATPAYVYATLSYGHQATACFLLLAYALTDRMHESRSPFGSSWMIGLSVAMAPLVELQVAPAALVLCLDWALRVIRSSTRMRSLIGFLLGASIPTAALLLYNQASFGSPWDLGYFHEDLQQFQNVHSQENRLGIRVPAWDLLDDLLISEHRGLLVFAPPLILAPLGWLLMGLRRRWAPLLVSLGLCLSVFLVNLSYPEWTGGWSTGPRLLLPLIPFAMLPLAALLAEKRRSLYVVLVILSLVGFVQMTGFQAVGGRIPPVMVDAPEGDPYHRPFREMVWPQIRQGRMFDRNLVSVCCERNVKELPPSWRWVQFGPLILFQFLSITAFMLWLKRWGMTETRAHATVSRRSCEAKSS